jgi:thymidylate kinase
MSIIEKEKEGAHVAVTETAETAFLVDLFKTFSQAEINYCVLRNYDGLPYDLRGSDLDILLRPDSVCRARRLIVATAYKHSGFAVWRELNDYNIGYFCCSGTDHKGRRWGVHIDLMIAFRWHGLDYYSSDHVLSRVVTRHGVRVANACDANLTAFLDKVLTICSMHKDCYGQAAAKAYAQLPDSTKEEIAATFGVKVEFLARALETKEPNLLKSFARKLRRNLLIHQMSRCPTKVFGNKLKRFKTHCHRLLKKMGILVVVLGLDGSGKSTLIELVGKEFERLVHTKTEVRHYRPRLLPAIGQLAGQDSDKISVIRNPHAKPPSGKIVSILRVAYCSTDYVLGYWLSLYPVLVKKGTVVFFDRYFYDYFIDPTRYFINAPKWVIRFFGWFIPKPDLILMLLPNAEKSIERKAELPIEVLLRQAEMIQKLGEKLKNVVWVDTSAAMEQSKEEMLQAIFDKFKNRPGWH